MGKINVLDRSVSELIAAGEVIERPASIVKELLENAIDAEATAVTVELKDGGVSFLRVTDNGSGMEHDDLPLAILRHATSKVSKEVDLDHIATLGFRGEALASITAVARVELLSKTRTAALGSKLVLHGGETVEFADAGCPDGTTILVRDLFYNVPARLKFLKKGTSEGNAVQSIVEKLAMSHPEVSFRLIKDNKTVLHTAGDGKLLSAVYAVLGKDFANSLIEVDYEHEGIHVGGFVTKPSFSRSNRAMQYFFVNDRFVKSKTCLVSLEESYKNSIMVSKFPGCVLKLTIDYSQVDVNVHPAKIEIRFVNEKPVFEAVYFAVKSALSKADILKTDVNENRTFTSRRIMQEPEYQAKQLNFSVNKEESLTAKPKDSFVRVNAEEYHQQFTAGSTAQKLHSTQVVPQSEGKPVERLIETIQAAKEPEQESVQTPAPEEFPAVQAQLVPPMPAVPQLDEDAFSFLDSTSFTKKEPEASEAPPHPIPASMPEETPETEPVQIRLIGELFKTYILFEANDLFVMLDKHAAHERILFERLKAQLKLSESQLLLAPLSMTLSAEECSVIALSEETFAEYGFRFSVGEKNTVTVLEAPLILHDYDLVELVQDLVKNIASCKMDLTPQKFEELLHSIACRAAIKANADNAPEELEELVEQVYLDEKIRHCPHGRPVGITMKRSEIERRFGRQT